MSGLLRSERVRAWVWQAVILGGLGLLIWWLAGNAARNLAARHIATGFGFLDNAAAIPIAESPISYVPSESSYGRALAVGVLNTLKASAVGIVLAMLIGTAVGIARLSPNRLASVCAASYVELLRDTPPLLQLLMWYSALQALPAARQALHAGPVVLSNRGLILPVLEWQTAHWAALAALVIVAGFIWRSAARWRWALLCVPMLVWAAMGAPFEMERPVLRGFNFVGGMTLSPEFAALVVGLVVYTSAYIAEIVRSGIQAIPKGQWEAAGALGFSRAQTLRLVILPQALRVILPPLASEFLNLTKNTTLAVAIGYQDIMSIGETTLNQTGQSIETIVLVMAFFLIVSLAISGGIGVLETRLARVGAR